MDTAGKRCVPRNYNPGYVYFIRGGDWVKIGLTSDVKRRMKELGTKPPFELELVHAFYAYDARGLERSLHEYFTEQRENGEWFRLDDYEIYSGYMYGYVWTYLETHKLWPLVGDSENVGVAG